MQEINFLNKHRLAWSWRHRLSVGLAVLCLLIGLGIGVYWQPHLAESLKQAQAEQHWLQARHIAVTRQLRWFGGLTEDAVQLHELGARIANLQDQRWRPLQALDELTAVSLTGVQLHSAQVDAQRLLLHGHAQNHQQLSAYLDALHQLSCCNSVQVQTRPVAPASTTQPYFTLSLGLR
ncbi:Tfp pilus assembly protein PilN [Ectothiorhodosinus mongolicus]|uniref:Tfp pilus assembly protein PilN n=1 Tax=Ectothiorhodosinus mongolicus TaxID=233100 RepID=A0A1R3VXP1_9GAMM|nr:hypothetical protein [Ectothiorhodosinus mongolicus]ULX56868.1 hypothetical protein CKX93_03605 [Ectothiorhodosinus mongolicus]SIT68730.1 Tfp pilus assembly protein PilN [Ectothiorhodosinus mongolicus]